MKKFIILLFLCLLPLSAFADILAQNTDESASSNYMGNSGRRRRLGQTITIVAASVESIMIHAGPNAVTPSGNVTCRLETIAAGQPTGTLAQANLTKAQAWTENADNLFTFASAGEVGAGDYWIRLLIDNQDLNDYFRIKYDTDGSGYAAGSQYKSDDGAAFTDTTFDMVFTVVGTPTVVDVGQVIMIRR